MDGIPHLALKGASLIDGLADDVHNAAQSLRSNGNCDRRAWIS
jgi:hypothetical protein